MQSSGLQTADVAIKADAGTVYGITISESAATACRVQLNDSTDDSGTDLFDIELVASPQPIHINFPQGGLTFATGIYLDVPTGSPNIIVYWG